VPVNNGLVGNLIGKADANFLPSARPDDGPQIASLEAYQTCPIPF